MRYLLVVRKKILKVTRQLSLWIHSKIRMMLDLISQTAHESNIYCITRGDIRVVLAFNTTGQPRGNGGRGWEHDKNIANEKRRVGGRGEPRGQKIMKLKSRSKCCDSPARSMMRRSIPMPNPAVGGIPCSRASKKSWSTSQASSSPAACSRNKITARFETTVSIYINREVQAEKTNTGKHSRRGYTTGRLDDDDSRELHSWIKIIVRARR